MALKIQETQSDNGQDYGRIEDGSYPARLVQVVDIGEQEQIDFETGNPTGKYQRRLFLTWEFPTEQIEINGENWPRWLSQEVTLSFHERAKLPQIIAALDPKKQANDLSELLGKPSLVTVGSTKNNKPKVTNVVQLPKGMQVGELKNNPVAFDMDDFDEEVFNSFPQFVQDKIKQARNFREDMLSQGNGNQESKAPAEAETAPSDYDDEIPF